MNTILTAAEVEAMVTEVDLLQCACVMCRYAKRLAASHLALLAKRDELRESIAGDYDCS